MVPNPLRGYDILPWASAVTAVCNRVGAIGTGRMLVREGPGGVGYAPLPENLRGKTAAAAAYPWKVEWAGDENDGEGSYVVYLPNPGSYIDASGATQSAVVAAITDLDDCEHRSSPWRLIEISETCTVYLSIKSESIDDSDDSAGDSDSSYVAAITTSKDDDAVNIPIAKITITTSAGSTTRMIEQYAYGTITFGGVGGKEYESGDDSNIVISDTPDPQTGKYKIDVYYV